MPIPTEIVFAGSSAGEPWWWLGQITAKLLGEEGRSVEVTSESSSYRNPYWIASGDAQLGGIETATILAATNRQGRYAKDDFPEFRAIARIERPCWFAMAATFESRISSLEQVARERLPVRMVIPQWTSVSSASIEAVLRYYGLSRESVLADGGRFHEVKAQAEPFVRNGDVDLLLGLVYLGNTPGTRYWNEASTLLNLRFLEIPEDLRAELARVTHGSLDTMPAKVFRGQDEEYDTVRRGDLLIYCRADLDDSFVYELAGLYERKGHEFLASTSVHMGYQATTAWQTPIPLHAGALRYYRERGLVE